MTATLLVSPAPAPMERSTSIRRALLFLLICAPIWLTPNWISVGHPIVTAVIVIALTCLFLRGEGRSLAVLGLDPSWRRVRELILGFAGGALVIVVMALCERTLLPFPWAWNPRFDLGVTAFSLLWFLSGNAVEELVFRGYSFERLIAGIGHWPAQIVTALLFAAFHVAGGMSWSAALMGTTAASLLFGLVFVRWRSVPAAAGVHAAVNWVRDLLLVDPPTVKTLIAPLAPRHWTTDERLTAMLILDGIFLLASAALAMSIRRRLPAARASRRT